MKLTALCLVALSTTVLAGCDDQSGDQETEFRINDNCKTAGSAATTTFKVNIRPNPEDYRDFRLSTDAVRSTAPAALGGTVRFNEEVASQCNSVCDEAGAGRWTGEGCLANGTVDTEIVGYVPGSGGRLATLQVDVDGDLGCQCDGR